MRMPKITIQKIQTDIFTALQSLLEPFAAEIALSGKSVLIKPNLVEPQPYTTGQTTNPALVDAVVAWCKTQGAGPIAIGEGPTYFQPRTALKECFTRTGIAEVAGCQGVPWILFDEGAFREFRKHSPQTPECFSLSEHAFSWDHILNVPVPKAHYLTTVSIAMKNLKGFIKREDKPSFHHCGTEGIHGSVAELNTLVRPSLNIVDCTAPTHQNKNFMLAGTDIVAVDTVTTALMGINPQQVRTLQLGYEKGLGEMDLSSIEIIGDDLKELRMSFEQPVQYLRRAFPKLALTAQAACSGCLIPLFASLKRIEQEGIRITKQMGIFCGRDAPESIPENSVFIGTCCKAYSGDRPLINKCPPAKEEMFEFLKDTIL